MRRHLAGLLALAALLAAPGCKPDRTTGDHAGTANSSLQISPPSATVATGQSIAFTATSPWGGDVRWAVLPITCGTFAQGGTFTAGSTPGPCVVIAALREDVRYTATVPIEVLAAPPPSSLPTDGVQASGGQQVAAGGVENVAIAGEPAAAVLTDPPSTLELRTGFAPTATP